MLHPLSVQEEDSKLWRDHEKAVDDRAHQLGLANTSLESKLAARRGASWRA